MKKANRKQTKHAEPSAVSLSEIPEMDFTKPVRRNPYAARIAAEGLVLPRRGRPRKGTETGPTVPRSIRFPVGMWKLLEKRAKAQGLTLHAALRAAIVGWMGRA